MALQLVDDVAARVNVDDIMVVVSMQLWYVVVIILSSLLIANDASSFRSGYLSDQTLEVYSTLEFCCPHNNFEAIL